MRQPHPTTQRRHWQCFTSDERLKLEALVDEHRHLHGKSAREVRAMLLRGETPPIHPKPLKKWERKKLAQSCN